MEDNKNLNSAGKTDNNISEDRLDSLLLDNNEPITNASKEDSAKFEAFMSEYRDLMGRNLAHDTGEEEKDDESQFLTSLPKKQAQKRKSQKAEEKSINTDDAENWDEGITLAPEEYVDPGEEDKIMHDELPEEEPEPDFNLGEPVEENEDKFQLSINFDGDDISDEEDKKSEKPHEEREYDPDKPRIIDWVFDLVEMFVFVLIAVMVLTSFFFKHSIVEGDSMLNTLEDGDHLIISDLFYSPERGDIVVFEDYSTMLKKAVVKRVIALPGETVEVKLNAKGEYEVYINGVYLEEEYAYNNIDFSAPGVGKWTVNEGEIFVMGDNRYNSTDSRDSRVGTVEIDSILGKVLFRFLPFEKFGKVE